MKKANQISRIIKTIFVLLLVLTAVPAKIQAEDPTVREYENSFSTDVFYEFELDKSTYDKERSNIPTKLTFPKEGETFTAYYPNALNYYGVKKSVKIDITYIGYNRYKKAGDDWIDAGSGRARGIRLEPDNDICMFALGNDYDITYSFYEDENFTTPANIYAAIAFEDPDLGNYWYAADTRKIYYIDVKDRYGDNKRLADYFKVNSKGVFSVDEDNVKYHTWYDFDYGTFGVPLENESSFAFMVEGKQDLLYLLVRIIMTQIPYKVAQYYETADGYPTEPDYISDPIYVDAYENPKVSVTDNDKKPNPEKGDGYVLDQDKADAWSLDLLPDGSTVLKVYFEQPYTIKYDPNCNDATGTMEDNNYRKSAPNMPSEATWIYERPGYEFIGYKVENDGEVLNGSADYKEYLLGQDDRTVVLYAQWKPLDYKIIYNKNANDATGEMPDSNYTGADEKMPSSDPWTFKRPGYKFVGYKVENEGTTFTEPDDFKSMLLKETDRTIELFAQWEELPYTIKYDPNGGTGEMPDDEYKGSDKTMPSKETWTFTREGYDFTGFKLENMGDLLNGSKEYRDTLLTDEDGVITLYAQWEPWKYTIKYDPNGGTGTMDDHIYNYEDPTMNSDPNQFTRKGYKFLGFVYTDPDGNQTLYKDPNDFRAEFIKLGKNSEILLVAQWKKIPVVNPEVHYYPPVTGVE